MLASGRVWAAACCAALVAGAPPVASAAEGASSLRAPNARPDLSSPEAGLWDGSDKAEAYVKRSGELNTDPELNAYVRGVVCKIAADYCGELRLYILERPFLNAAAAPNGYLEVNTGLLLRARSEDELAYVLGHEVSHFGRNHSLAQWNKTKSTANVMLALQIGVTVGAAAAMYSASSNSGPDGRSSIDSISQSAQQLNNLIYLAGIASIFAFSREQESEADRLGYGRAVDAGYAKTAGPQIWTAVIDETQASDFPKVRKSEAHASIFNSHPVTSERVKALSELAGAPAGTGEAEAERRYRSRIRPHLGRWLRDDLRRRDFGQTLFLIGRMEREGEDAGLLAFYRGEAYRLRRGEADGPAALAAYQAAVAQPDAPVAAWRELGEALRKSGDKAAAASAFEGYLARAPQAEDRWLIEASLKNLKPTETP